MTEKLKGSLCRVLRDAFSDAVSHPNPEKIQLILCKKKIGLEAGSLSSFFFFTLSSSHKEANRISKL
jgi:hypothetical protein